MIQSFVILKEERNKNLKGKKNERALNRAGLVCPQHLLPRLLQATVLLVCAPG